MDEFLPQNDGLSKLIQQHASELYKRLSNINVDQLGLPYHCLHYYKGSHATRLFFSIETSAHLLYRSISITKKNVEDIVIMDYGAGVGTLYLLAKMIGCRTVIYNDHLEDWKTSAQKIAEAIGIKIDEYITGDIDETLQVLSNKDLHCDIVVSRNVIEHIYKLNDFHNSVYKAQPAALIYSSTTANYYNPGSHIKHILWHRKWEKVYRAQRIEIIRKQEPSMAESKIELLAKATRGLAVADLHKAINEYSETEMLPNPVKFYTNTCDPSNGVWAEHLLKFKQYREYINADHFTINFVPGFWDTHYSKSWKNLFSKMFNSIIKGSGKLGFIIAPFIYVVAEPKTTK
jgi:2-polyprenyl-3-methyl-5-hydroxy-6-metoxy-1,4-benzoquinol methylase